MASDFNLTAQINLQGPTNLKPIVAQIKRELGSIETKVNLNINANSSKNIASINSKLRELNKLATSANASVKGLSGSLSDLAGSFNKLASSSSASVNGITNTNKAVESTKKVLAATTTEIEEFGKQSGLAIRRFAAFSTVTSVVYGLVNAFSSAYKEFINFDREIVRLSQVTGESVSSLKSVGDEITRLSTSLGVASSELLVVSTTLAQAGLSAADTRIALEALAKSSLAPSFESLTDTTEGAIAVLRQFGLQAGDLEGALGSINEVSAAFAVEAGDLIAAIQRTGGVFASSSRGVSEGKDALNEFLAVFTSVRQTTRESAETIATGLRTIFTRIQREDTIKALRQYGIELTDLEGKFVGPFEAVKRLSEGLGRLDPRSLDFSRITEELGGFRQIGKVIPLIQQFAVAQEALKVAQRGQDSLAKDAAIAQESLANRFTKTRESFVALVRDIGGSTTFKGLAEGVLVLANSLITVTKALEPLLPLLTAFAAIKIGSSLTQFASGFGKGFGGRGGSGGLPVPTPPTSPQTPSPSAVKSETSLVNNTTALSALLSPINNLLQNINILNQTLVQTNALLKSRPVGGSSNVRGFARGGLVPGRGNRDTVPAMLTPGEFVIRKNAVQALGLENLFKLNKYAIGGQVPIGNVESIGAAVMEFKAKKIARGTRTLAESKNYKKLLELLQLYADENEIKNIVNKQYELIREGLDRKEYELFDSSLTDGLVGGVNISLRKLASSQLGDFIKINRSQDKYVQNFLDSINNASKGNLFESVILSAEKSGVFDNADNPQRPFDFVGNLKSGLISRLYPGISSLRYVDAKSSFEEAEPKELINKIADQYIEELNDLVKGGRLKPVRRARGGGISGQDTVPALLTPGEFVINKRAAQRIGYHNLRRLNYADKIKGYNKGGVVGLQKLNTGGAVQKFAEGGQVSRSDLFAIGAIFTSILQPQVEKLANSFVDANGKVNKFIVGLSGAIREVSSLVGSSLIGLSAVGANANQRLLGGVVAGVGGGLGGAFTAAGAKTLEEALKDNTTALSAFEKLVIEAEQATDPTEQIKASARVQKSYIELSETFNKNQSLIESSTFWQELGNTVTNATTTFLLLQTSILALNQAVTQSITVQNARNASVAKESIYGGAVYGKSSSKEESGALGWIQNLTASIPALSKFTKFLSGAILWGTRFIGFIGLAISAFQLVTGIINAVSLSYKKSGEESLKLANALQKSTKANTDFTLNNERFSGVLLQRYRELLSLRSRGEISDTQLNRIVSSLNPQDALRTPGTRAFNVELPNNRNITLAINDLSASLRTFLSQEAAQYKLSLDSNKSLIDALQQLRGQGLGADVNRFTNDLGEILQKYLLQTFLQLRNQEGETNVGASTKEFNDALAAGGPAFEAVLNKISDFTASADRAKFATALVAESNLILSQRVVSLSDVFSNFQSKLSAITATIEFNNKSLQNQISLFDDQPRVSGGADNIRLQAQILNNLRGFDEDQVASAISRALQLILPISSPETNDIRQSIATNINALRALEDSLPALLKNVTGQTDTPGLDKLEEGLVSVLEKRARLDANTASRVAENIRLAVVESFSKQEFPSADKLISQVTSLGSALDAGRAAQQIAIIAFEETAKVLDIVNENVNQYAIIIAKIRDLESKRFTAISDSNIQLRTILGEEIKKAELNKVFDEQISKLTGGRTTARSIVDFQNSLREASRANIQARENDPTNSALLTEAAQLASQLQSSNDALQLIINSSDKLKNAFDALTEKEKKLFEGPQDLLEDLIKNPQRVGELNRVLKEDLPKVLAGTGDREASARVLEKLVPLFRSVGRTEEADKIRAAAFGNVIGQAAKELRVDDFGGAVAVFQASVRNFASTNPFTKGILLQPEVAEVRTQQSEVDTAYGGLISATKELEKLIKSQGIINPLKTFNEELPNIIGRRLAAENKLTAGLESAISQRSTPKTDSAVSSLINTIQLRINKDIIPALRPAKPISISDFFVSDPRAFGAAPPVGGVVRPQRPVAIPGELSKLSDNVSNLPQTINELSNAIDNLESQNARGTLEENKVLREQILALYKERDRLRALENKLLSQPQQEIQQPYRMVPNIIPRLQVPRTPPQQQEPRRPFDDPLSSNTLKRTFESITSSFSQALIATGELVGNNLVLQLGGVFSNLDRSVSNFKSSADSLIANLDNFNRRGGIKGPNIPQEVTVRVSFDEDLTVVAENQNTTTVLDNIGSLVSSVVADQLNSLNVFGTIRRV